MMPSRWSIWGEGSFLLTSQISHVAHLGDQVARPMEEEGVTLDEIFEALDEGREADYREQLAQQVDHLCLRPSDRDIPQPLHGSTSSLCTPVLTWLKYARNL
jgi:hypothetical protein